MAQAWLKLSQWIGRHGCLAQKYPLTVFWSTLPASTTSTLNKTFLKARDFFDKFPGFGFTGLGIEDHISFLS